MVSAVIAVSAAHHNTRAEGGEHGTLPENTLVDAAQVFESVHLTVADIRVHLDTLVVSLGQHLAGGKVNDSGTVTLAPRSIADLDLHIPDRNAALALALERLLVSAAISSTLRAPKPAHIFMNSGYCSLVTAMVGYAEIRGGRQISGRQNNLGRHVPIKASSSPYHGPPLRYTGSLGGDTPLSESSRPARAVLALHNS